MSEDVTPYGVMPTTNHDVVVEIRALIERNGWSQRRLAKALGADERLFRDWLAERVPVPAMALFAVRYLAGDFGNREARVARGLPG